MAEDRQPGLSRRAHWAGGDKLISRLMAEALARPDLVSLAAGFVDQAALPVEATQEAVAALWSDPAVARAALQYGTTIGHVPLREAIVARLEAADQAAGLRPAPSLGSSRGHGRQQPASAPSGRYAPGPWRHRALRRAELFRLHGHVGQRWGENGRRGDRLRRHDPRGPRARTGPAEGGRGTGPRESRSIWSPITTIRRALPPRGRGDNS